MLLSVKCSLGDRYYDTVTYAFLRVSWEYKGRNPSLDLGDQGILLEEVKSKLTFEKWVGVK